MTAAVDRSRSGLERWAALGGVLYVVLFVIGTIFQFSGAPNGDAAPSKVIAWYSDSGHRDRLNIGWILIGLGGVAAVGLGAVADAVDLRTALYVCAAAPVAAIFLALPLPSSRPGRRLQVEPVVP